MTKSSQKEPRQSWTYQEDQLLLELVQKHGAQSWNIVSSEFMQLSKKQGKLRSSAACRERYQNILDPSLKKAPWSLDEEQKLFKLQRQLGNSWAKISQAIPGRSELICKNYFYATLRKVLRRLCRAVGKDQASEMLKQIKPSILGLLYSKEMSEQRMELNKRKEYQQIIAKYRHLDKKDYTLLSETEAEKIKELIEGLIRINEKYNESKSESRLKRKVQNLISLNESESIKKIKLQQIEEPELKNEITNRQDEIQPQASIPNYGSNQLGTPLVCNSMAMQYQMWNYQMHCNYAQQYQNYFRYMPPYGQYYY